MTPIPMKSAAGSLPAPAYSPTIIECRHIRASSDGDPFKLRASKPQQFRMRAAFLQAMRKKFPDSINEQWPFELRKSKMSRKLKKKFKRIIPYGKTPCPRNNKDKPLPFTITDPPPTPCADLEYAARYLSADALCKEVFADDGEETPEQALQRTTEVLRKEREAILHPERTAAAALALLSSDESAVDDRPQQRRPMIRRIDCRFEVPGTDLMMYKYQGESYSCPPYIKPWLPQYRWMLEPHRRFFQQSGENGVYHYCPEAFLQPSTDSSNDVSSASPSRQPGPGTECADAYQPKPDAPQLSQAPLYNPMTYAPQPPSALPYEPVFYAPGLSNPSFRPPRPCSPGHLSAPLIRLGPTAFQVSIPASIPLPHPESKAISFKDQETVIYRSQTEVAVPIQGTDMALFLTGGKAYECPRGIVPWLDSHRFMLQPTGEAFKWYATGRFNRQNIEKYHFVTKMPNTGLETMEALSRASRLLEE